MPENENKTLTPEEIKEQKQVALDKAIEKVSLDANNAPDLTTQAAIRRQNLTDEQKSTLGVTNAIHGAYSPAIASMGNTITELETARKNAKAQDETAQRRSRNMQTIAGISDSLASLANLIGVGQGGTNINMGTGALTPLQQKAEAARLERKADIKSIDDRLEQYKNQLLQMKMQKGAALAGYAQKKEEKASDRAYDAQKTKDAQAFQEKILGLQQAHAAEEAAKGRAHESAENALTRTHQEKLNKEDNESREAIANANREQQKNTSGANALRPVKLINADGTTTDINVSKGEYDAIVERFEDIVKMDGIQFIEKQIVDPKTKKVFTTEELDRSTPLGKAYGAYMDAVEEYRAGSLTDQDVEDKRNAVINASPTMRKMLEDAAKKSRWSNNKV